jgi:hypothetical protein
MAGKKTSGGGGESFRIEVEGYEEFRRAVARADKELAKRIGQVHKGIGAFVISKLEPKSVGEGAGAKVRPSATVREVLLRVGGGWRDERARQWGKRQEFPGGLAPERPDIIGTARNNQAEIEQRLLDAIDRALKPPFL